MPTSPLPPATLCGVPLHQHFHACAFVSGRANERELLTPFIAEGLRQGEKALYIVEDAELDAHRAALLEAAAAGDESQLVFTTWTQTYLADNRFSPQKMLENVRNIMKEASEAGFPRVRIVGQMGWAMLEGQRVEDLVRYEVEVNRILEETRNPAVCVYDVDALSGSTMMDLLRAHPLTIVNGVLYTNPFFTPPEQMLVEIRARQSALSAA